MSQCIPGSQSPTSDSLAHCLCILKLSTCRSSHLEFNAESSLCGSYNVGKPAVPGAQTSVLTSLAGSIADPIVHARMEHSQEPL